MLNTTIIDKFFRSLNGNTQVNATDVRSLPFPRIEDIRKIGEVVCKFQSYQRALDVDNIVAQVLGINIEMLDLNKGETKDEQN
jgi:adenine-specific DNA-methyltransferase